MSTKDAELPPYALEISPDTALKFDLTKDGIPPSTSANSGSTLQTSNSTPAAGSCTSRCVMTLRHPNITNTAIAFKVKTTQPRRYLVRPNQGIIASGGTEIVTILLTEKDRQALVSSYEKLGQSALDNSKDKFLVQSCAVDDAFADRFSSSTSKTEFQNSEAMSGMWNAATTGSNPLIHNKKLQVEHICSAGESHGAGSERSSNNVDSMNPEQMLNEITSLRRKYDELVTFSVNLTADRDILNNTLEQTKRDLNREMAARTALEKGGRRLGRTLSLAPEKAPGGSLFTIMFVSALFFLVGIKASSSEFLMSYLGNVLGSSAEL